MKLLLLASWPLLLATPAEAYESSLPAKTLVCMTRERLDAATEAIRRGVAYAPGCFVTGKPAPMERLSCSWSSCKILIHSDAGDAVAFVRRADLSGR